ETTITSVSSAGIPVVAERVAAVVDRSIAVVIGSVAGFGTGRKVTSARVGHRGVAAPYDHRAPSPDSGVIGARFRGPVGSHRRPSRGDRFESLTWLVVVTVPDDEVLPSPGCRAPIIKADRTDGGVVGPTVHPGVILVGAEHEAGAPDN